MALASDGCTNVRGEHIVNFIIKTPDHQPFFLKSIDTSGVSQNAPAIADKIGKVIEEVGVQKSSAVITDNAPVMQFSWEQTEVKYPTIAAYGCAAQGVKLLIKEIVSNPKNSKTIKIIFNT